MTSECDGLRRYVSVCTSLGERERASVCADIGDCNVRVVCVCVLCVCVCGVGCEIHM